MARRLIAGIVFSIFMAQAMAQAYDDPLTPKLIRASFDAVPSSQSPYGRFPKFKKRASYFNPLAYLGAGALFVYQNVVSQQIQAACVYQVSCSEQARQAIARYGIVRGLLEGLSQLQDCSPGALHEHPPLFIAVDGKVINTFDEAVK